MKKSAALALALTLCAAPVLADEGFKPDDRVTFSLSAEGWATTSTARVEVTVDAAVAGAAAANARAEMQKAVNGLAKGEWRLTGFTRSQDQTGLERWSTNFEARLAEADLAGLHDAAKKASKAGMQLTVGTIAFDPTLAEIEAVKAKLRTDLYKQANDQLAALNAALPARQYRIGALDFVENGMPPMIPRPGITFSKGVEATTMVRVASSGADMSMDGTENMNLAQKITQQVQVTFAAVPPVAGK